MNWLKELYLGEKAGQKAKKLVRAAVRGKKGPNDGCFLITLSSFPKGQLDLLRFSDTRKKSVDTEKLTVVGLAADQAEAFSLIEKIADDCVKATGGAELKAYLSGRETVDWRGVRL